LLFLFRASKIASAIRLIAAIAAQIPIPAFAPEVRAEFELGDAACDADDIADEAAPGPEVSVDTTAVETMVVTMVRAVGAGTTVDEVIVANSWI
jgi:hypothetical protein